MKIFSLGPDEDRRTCWKLVSLKNFSPVYEKISDYIWKFIYFFIRSKHLRAIWLEECLLLYINGHSGCLQGQGFWSSHYSPWVGKALERSGVSNLAVKVLTQNVRDVSLNPTWSQIFPTKWMFQKENLFQNLISL